MSDLEFGDGVFFFPVTPFDAADRVDLELVATLVDRGVARGAGGVFPACGTGEFHALSLSEYDGVVSATAAAVAGRVPIIAGVGGPLGHARDVARAAEGAGATGLLVMPPYLVSGPQRGLVGYVTAIARTTRLPLIVYHRGLAQFTVESVAQLLSVPTVIGIKDGVGDVALTQRFVLEARRTGRDILFFNGLLTAELSQAAYAAIGVPLYSSAVFAMAPDIAMAFYRAYRAGDENMRLRLIDGFYSPLVALRDETPGFAVSLIKAGLRLDGIDVGSVRPPLVDPDADQLARLRTILDRGRDLLT